MLFAFGLVLVGERGKPILHLIERMSAIIFRIVGFIMWAAPIGAFGAIAFTVGRFGAGSLASLGALLLEFYVVCLLFVFIVLGGVARACGVSLFRLLYYIREEILIVAATTSSETVLPRMVQKLEALGCEESVVGLVVPTGYSFNLDGTCLYLATVVVFLAQATNTPLDLTAQLGLLAVMLLTSKGAAGDRGRRSRCARCDARLGGDGPGGERGPRSRDSPAAGGGAHLRQHRRHRGLGHRRRQMGQRAGYGKAVRGRRGAFFSRPHQGAPGGVNRAAGLARGPSVHKTAAAG